MMVKKNEQKIFYKKLQKKINENFLITIPYLQLLPFCLYISLK